MPSLYEPRYREDGTLSSFEPLCPEAPASVRRLVMSVLDRADFIDTPLVPFIRVTQDRSVLELMRGCIRGCRFCQAGNVYRPQREHSVEYLKRYAEKLLKITGNEEISLSSLSSSDYSRLQEFLEYLIQYTKERKINISLPSLRIDAFSLDVMQRIQDVKKSSLTFAPEAGTQRLRDVINKGITEEDIMRGVSSAFHGGWTKVKFYFMLGLRRRRRRTEREFRISARESPISSTMKSRRVSVSAGYRFPRVPLSLCRNRLRPSSGLPCARLRSIKSAPVL